MGTFQYVCAGISSIDGIPATPLSGIILPVTFVAKNEKSLIKSSNLVHESEACSFVLDSGGFQLHMLENKIFKQKLSGSIEDHWSENPCKPIKYGKRLNLTTSHVIRAAMRLQPDIVIGLDFPIRDIDGLSQQCYEYQKKTMYNIRWAREMSDMKYLLPSRTKLFLPVQCYNITQLKDYYKQIQSLPYDGIAFPVRNMSLTLLSDFLIKIVEFGVRQVHILGTTAFSKLVIGAYFAKHYYDWISFDSRSHFCYAQHEHYLHPNNLKKIDAKFNSPDVNTYTVQCYCNRCQYHRFSEITTMYYTKKMRLLQHHNYVVTKTVAERLFDHCDSFSEYQLYLESLGLKQRTLSTLVNQLARINTRLKRIQP